MRRQVTDRTAALLLLVAALLGLITANTPIGPYIYDALHYELPTGFLGFSLDPSGWIKDGLLAIFFLIAAIELRHEFRSGELASARRALVPVVAAVGGVIAPAAIFLLMVPHRGLSIGWPIPTATDIAFALGLLAMVGKGLPKRIRALLLALAVIDDLIAIFIIGTFFTEELNPLPLLAAIPVVLVFGWLSFRSFRFRTTAMVLLAVGAWWLVMLSDVHPTIAGVALGLVLAEPAASKVKTKLEPITNQVILPIFAFTAASVLIPKVEPAHLSPVFWAIVVALPLGKLVGISVAGFIASRLAVRRSDRTKFADLILVALLGGVGFTVSLLMNELAFEGSPIIAAEGTLAVLTGSAISAVLGLVYTAVRARTYRRLTPLPSPPTLER
ncbi:MAG: Na+/H+ antiporter NhaA, partial [Cryobacterium sp.]|nr:Na+/H+ antiporter NhaA [Cryobacterium sp.]MBX3090498.1 Na+/H+ antiporter NhaA [Cryobacterium sp.]MCO5293889.1 Na+/H+ antiporter NhaA [Homoserinimonas sp.]